MPETVGKPEDKNLEELIEGLKKSMKDIAEGKTYSADEVREEIEGK